MFLSIFLLAQVALPLRFVDRVPEPAPQVEFAVPPGRVAVKWYTLSLVGTAPTNGDDDGYADADETNDMTLTLVNGPVAVTNLVVTISTGDATVECVNTAQVTIPSVAAGATVTTPPFRFKVAGPGIVNRTDILQSLYANFDVKMRSDQFPALDREAKLTLPLDQDVAGGSGPTTFIEDFEVANGPSGLGKFVLDTLDAGKNSLAASNGMRCQYNDPDGPNTQSAGNTECFLGFAGFPDTNDWHLHTTTAAMGGVGRAYTGGKSLHWGVHQNATASQDTTRFKQMDAVDSIIINLQAPSTHPELSFAHQISLVGAGTCLCSVSSGEALDRAIVMVNALNANGTDGPVWERLEPYWNRYDLLGTDDYSNCTFDPVDDGNNEDSYYDPSDPNRHLGPSSTCMDQRVFSRAGDTDYRNTADPTKIALAGDGPGLQGAINVGTWVRPAFNLQKYAGRRIKIRLLATSLEVGVTQTFLLFSGRQDWPWDDGWYVDDVRVSSTLTNAATLVPDADTITPIPCVPCGSINAALNVTPNLTSAPGNAVTLDAGGTSVDSCLMGPKQYQFWVDGNGNGIAGDAGDTLLRDFSDLPTALAAPDATEQLAVIAACPGEPLCDTDGSATAVATVTVNCPPGITRSAFGQTIYVEKGLYGGYIDTEIRWTAPKAFNWVRGCLFGTCSGGVSLRGSGTFTGTVDSCLSSPSAASSVIDTSAADTTPGNTWFYLVRGRVAACGATAPGYTTNAASESPGRDAALDADPVAGTCP
jgi:hypothetical protein